MISISYIFNLDMSYGESLQFVPGSTANLSAELSTYEKVVVCIANATVNIRNARNAGYSWPSLKHSISPYAREPNGIHEKLKAFRCGLDYYTGMEWVNTTHEQFTLNSSCLCLPSLVNLNIHSLQNMQNLPLFSTKYAENQFCQYLNHEIEVQYQLPYHKELSFGLWRILAQFPRITVLRIRGLHLLSNGTFFGHIFNSSQFEQLESLSFRRNSELNQRLIEYLSVLQNLKRLRIESCHGCKMNVQLSTSLEVLILDGFHLMKSFPQSLKVFTCRSKLFLFDSARHIPNSLTKLRLIVNNAYFDSTIIKDQQDMMMFPGPNLKEVQIYIGRVQFTNNGSNPNQPFNASHGQTGILTKWLTHGVVSQPLLLKFYMASQELFGRDQMNLNNALASGKFPKLMKLTISCFIRLDEHCESENIRFTNFTNATSDIMISILTHPTLIHIEAPSRFLLPDGGKALLTGIDNGSFQPETHKFCNESGGPLITITETVVSEWLQRESYLTIYRNEKCSTKIAEIDSQQPTFIYTVLSHLWSP